MMETMNKDYMDIADDINFTGNIIRSAITITETTVTEDE